MKKYIFILLMGITIMAGGCVPFGIAIKNSFNANEVFNETITINKKYRSGTIKVNTQFSILPALKIHLTSNEINRNNSDDFGDEYEAKYQFPIQLVVTNNSGKKLYEYNGKLKWNSGTRSYDLNNVNSRQGEVVVKIDMEKISAPASGEIQISVLLEEDRFYYAKIHSAQLVVYDNVHQHTSTILTGVAIIITGIIVFIIGLVMLILKQLDTKQQTKVANSMDNDKNLNTTNNKNSNHAAIHSTAMLCHLSTFAGLIIPFGGILGPLILWQIKKDEDPFINRHGIAALNFHLSMAIYYFVSFLLAFVVVGFFLLAILAVTELILVIIASIKASNGEEYKYPLAINFIKVQE